MQLHHLLHDYLSRIKVLWITIFYSLTSQLELLDKTLGIKHSYNRDIHVTRIDRKSGCHRPIDFEHELIFSVRIHSTTHVFDQFKNALSVRLRSFELV